MDISATPPIQDSPPIEATPPTSTRRFSRIRYLTNAFLNSVAQQGVSFEHIVHHVHQPAPYQLPKNAPLDTIAFTNYYEVLHQDDYNIQDELSHSIQSGVTLQCDQVMKADDRIHFQDAMIEEFGVHSKRNYYSIIDRNDVPDDEDVLDSVWATKRKKNILTNNVYKYKARLNLHGGQQKCGINFFEAYSPVVS